jgi:site-specific DNA-adenine methylase
MACGMRSSSFIRYPGGKDKLKHHIIPELIARRNGSMQYREPFCGGFSGLQYLEHTADSIQPVQGRAL